jgi:hypothetical protein
MTSPDRIPDLVVRIQAAYLDEPQLALTLDVAAGRFEIDRWTCEAVLETLREAHVLTARRGVYRRFFPLHFAA